MMFIRAFFKLLNQTKTFTFHKADGKCTVEGYFFMGLLLWVKPLILDALIQATANI